MMNFFQVREKCKEQSDKEQSDPRIAPVFLTSADPPETAPASEAAPPPSDIEERLLFLEEAVASLVQEVEVLRRRDRDRGAD